MTMIEDFNQYQQPMAQPLGKADQREYAFASAVRPQTDPFIGEMVDERMQWQSPARNQILQDFNLNPATTGAGFQMQGTNTPSIVADMTGHIQPINLTGSQATGYGMQFDPNQGQFVPNRASTGFYNPQDNAFAMGSPAGTGTISSIVSPQSGFSDDYGLRVNTGNPALYPNYLRSGFDYAQAAQNFDFPMGGRYNYSTTPGFGAGWSDPIINYDPYNALANTGMYGYGFSQPNFPIMENYIPDPVLDPRGYQMFDPFQSYR